MSFLLQYRDAQRATRSERHEASDEPKWWQPKISLGEIIAASVIALALWSIRDWRGDNTDGTGSMGSDAWALVALVGTLTTFSGIACWIQGESFAGVVVAQFFVWLAASMLNGLVAWLGTGAACLLYLCLIGTVCLDALRSRTAR